MSTVFGTYVSVLLGGLLLLGAVVLTMGLLQRQLSVAGATVQQDISVGALGASLYTLFVTPVLALTCFGARGFEFTELGAQVGSLAVGRWAVGVVLVTLGGLYWIPGPRGLVWGGFERVGVTLLLGWVWGVVFQSTGLLPTILWLEVAGFLALLLLLTATPATESRVLPQLQALLVLLWVNGLATLGFVWSFTLGVQGLPVSLSGLWGGVQVGRGDVGTSFFMAALLFKLMAVPFQSLLVSFYRALGLRALAPYLFFYYGPLLIAIIFCLFGFGASVGSVLVWGVAGGAGVAVILFAGVVGARVDLRLVLAASTVANVTLLLLGAAVGAG